MLAEQAGALLTSGPDRSGATRRPLLVFNDGYLSRNPSNRRLERGAERNIELMCLTMRRSSKRERTKDFHRNNGLVFEWGRTRFSVTIRPRDFPPYNATLLKCPKLWAAGTLYPPNKQSCKLVSAPGRVDRKSLTAQSCVARSHTVSINSLRELFGVLNVPYKMITQW